MEEEDSKHEQTKTLITCFHYCRLVMFKIYTPSSLQSNQEVGKLLPRLHHDESGFLVPPYRGRCVLGLI